MALDEGFGEIEIFNGTEIRFWFNATAAAASACGR